MLYHVLAVVKDPDAIAWLERIRSTPSGKSELAEHWLPHWATYFRGAAPEQLKWLTGADLWGAFFRKWIQEEPDSGRLAVVEALRGWFHDEYDGRSGTGTAEVREHRRDDGLAGE